MRLRPGVRLGPYEIIGLLGTGGMGEVYRARDAKLHRDVAVKVLPDFVESGSVPSSNVQSRRSGSNADRLARFEREARLLASLNHPNIAHVYGLEEAEGVRALVMELVEGETLEMRIGRGPLNVRDTLAIAQQIADALEAAHDQGIVHRDLKPANIKVGADGTVKVLDFGIAKALNPLDATDTPTVLNPATDLGVIIGTAAYMAPEQARGKPVDKRADIWSFGVVLYEMLTGRRPFEGETVSDTLSAVLEREPDWNRLPPDTPLGLRTLLKRTLRKDPKQRLRDVADTFIGEVDGSTVARPGAEQPRRSWTWIASTVALLLAVPLAALLGWRYARSNVDPGWTGEVLGGTSIAVGPRISPDGAMLAFQAWVDGLNQVAVMKPESGNWTVLTHDRSRGQIMDVSWSPDGTRVYFDRYLDVPRGVFAVPVLGGDARPIVDDAIYPKALPDGSLLVVKLTANRRFQLHHFWPDKGRTDPLPAFWTPNQGLPLVAAFPDGREAVFYGLPAGAESGAAYSLNVIDLASTRSRVLDASIEIVQGAFSGGLAIAPDTGQVLVDTPAGNLHRIVAIARDGSRRAVLTLSAQTAYLDAGRDGTIYADQLDRIGEILRGVMSGGVPERVAMVPSAIVGEAFPLSLPDGRVLLSSRLSGRMRIMVAGGGHDPTPLLETQAESRTPAAIVTDDEIAFVIDTPPNQTIAIASLTTGRVLRRLEATRGASVASLAASRDRQTIFYASRGTVWAVPITDGPTRRIHQGDAVAVDPRSGELVVQLFDASGARLVRLDPAGGSERPIPFTSDVFMALLPMSGSAVDQQGRVLVQVTGRDFWFWQPGVVDPSTGRLDRIPLNYDGDVLSPGWSRDGAVVSAGFSLASSIWRFRRQSP